MVWLALSIGHADAGPSPDADAKRSCVEGYEGYQIARKKGELRAARSSLLRCLQSQCPASVQKECADWSAELDRALPSVVLSATVDGVERSDVAVDLDGQIITQRLDGKAIDVDPGAHTFRFRYSGYPAIEQTVILKEGDKLRVVSAAFGKAPAPLSTTRSEAPPASPAGPNYRPIPALFYVFGGLTVVSLATFATTATLGKNKESELRGSGCQPFCAKSDVDSIRTYYLAADVSLGIAAASAVTTAVVFFLRPSRPLEGSKLPPTAGPMSRDTRPLVRITDWAVVESMGGAQAVVSGAF